MFEYNGYRGEVRSDDDALILHGQIVSIRDVVTFQGATLAELRQAFQDSVDDYLVFCRQRGEKPDAPVPAPS